MVGTFALLQNHENRNMFGHVGQQQVNLMNAE